MCFCGLGEAAPGKDRGSICPHWFWFYHIKKADYFVKALAPILAMDAIYLYLFVKLPGIDDLDFCCFDVGK